MRISEFATQYGRESRPIRSVLAEWQLGEIRGLLENQPGRSPGQSTAAMDGAGDAVVLGDMLHGQTLLDELPTDLRQAFTALMKYEARDVRGMRAELLRHLYDAEGEFMPFDDPRVVGFVSKIKGQIGENLFATHVGQAATLASSGSQEGWDVAVRQLDGSHEYVQVKLYQSPSGVVRHMLEVQQKILAGQLGGIGDEHVSQVYFAVPEDIHDDILRLAERHEGLASMIYDKSIPISSKDAAGIVHDGLSNVGPEQLEHFFGELLCGVAIAGSIHGLVNGFLWYLSLIHI